MPAFSRLQLAQALLEYDNDGLPPEAPRRSAHDSAIFAHLRRARGPPRPSNTVYEGDGPQRSTNYLSVKLPQDHEAAETELGTGLRGSVGARRSIDIQNALHTRNSVDVLRSDWGDKRASRVENSELGYLDEDEEDAPEEGMDLSSWGLDKFVVKPDQEKRSKSRQSNFDKRASVMSRSPSDALPNPFARTPTPSAGLRDPGDGISGPSERPKHAHSQSDLGAGHAFLDAQRSEENLAREPSLRDRRRSVANPLDLEEYRARGPHVPFDKRRQSVGILPSESVPFPSSDSPAPLADNDDMDLPNPFALPAPPTERLSRFDPKAQRPLSQLGVPETQGDTASVLTGTMREGTVHARTYSNASMGSRALLDDFRDDGASYMTGRPLEAPGNKPISRMELLRPKVLVMPSPLQGSERQQPQSAGRAGFMVSSDGTPLPPGATPGARPGVRPLTGAGASRSNVATSVMGSGFTPNPRTSMSLSQLTFRNNLMVDGARDVAYNDIEQQLHRATAEGERVEQVWGDYEEETEAPEPERPAGRLYGRSLMDDLQDRKAQIHGRQRVFRGDNRPAMMERGQIRRPGTLIDSAALQTRPDTVLLPHGPMTSGTDQRPNAHRASTIQPLLSFDSEAPGRAANSKSVFGVDTVWEREMARLKEIQEQQRLDQEAQKAREEEKQKRKGKKIKKNRGKNEPPLSPSAPETEPPAPELNRMSSAPPILPNITPLNQQVPPASPHESEASLPPANRRRRSVATLDAGGWFAGSSDEEDSGAKRDSGPRTVPVSGGRDDDSDDDVPLTNIKVNAPASDDDEDAPLSSLKPKQGVLPDLKPASTLDIAASLGLAPESTQTKASKADDSDDDEVPLAIRRQTIMPQSPGNKPGAGNDDDDDDDEKPLGLRLSQAPNAMQQRRQAEYQQMMLMQQQQQQQQLLMQQNAMHASMFGGSMLSFQPGFGGPGSVHSFGAPMFGGMPVQDPKLSRVDQWRHGVEGNDS